MDKLSECKNILEQTQKKVTSSVKEWKAFLRFSAQIYKYDFTSALLIYAHRPDAKALASMDIWNRVGRRINPGAKGIPILINSASCVQLSYVFDVSDTNGAQNTVPVPWKLNSTNQNTVLIDLEDRYGIKSNGDNLDQRIQTVIEAVMQESCDEYSYDILQMIEGTQLEKLNNSEIDGIIQDFLSDSITQMVYSRVAPESKIPDSLIFDDLPFLMNPNHIAMLGAACIKHSGQLLRQIESSVKQIQHEQKIQQRRLQNVSQVQRAERSSLSAISNTPAKIRQAPDQIRNDLQKISRGNTAGQIRNTAEQSGIDENLSSERGRSEPVRDDHTNLRAKNP